MERRIFGAGCARHLSDLLSDVASAGRALATVGETSFTTSSAGRVFERMPLRPPAGIVAVGGGLAPSDVDLIVDRVDPVRLANSPLSPGRREPAALLDG